MNTVVSGGGTESPVSVREATVEDAPRLLDPVDENAFVVRLADLSLGAGGGRRLPAEFDQVWIRPAAVQFGLAKP